MSKKETTIRLVLPDYLKEEFETLMKDWFNERPELKGKLSAYGKKHEEKMELPRRVGSFITSLPKEERKEFDELLQKVSHFVRIHYTDLLTTVEEEELLK